MTPLQLEKKARQLLYRKKLADTIECLETSIKAYMQVEEKEELRTKSFVIRLDGEKLFLKLLPKIDPRQLRINLK